MPDLTPRLHLPFEQDWNFHLGEVGHIPRLSQKAAGQPGPVTVEVTAPGLASAQAVIEMV